MFYGLEYDLGKIQYALVKNIYFAVVEFYTYDYQPDSVT